MRRGATLAVIAALAVACGGETGGKEIALGTQVKAAPEVAAAFTTPRGWSVKLTRAAISLGALYYFDGPPAVAAASSPTWLRRLAQLSPLSVARAHPGHYVAGDALGQMLTPATVDLLAGPASLAAGNGVTGLYRSARLAFASPVNEAARALLGGDNVGIVEGAATKEGQTVYFRLTASLADVARSVSMGHVDGCVFEESDIDESGLVSVLVSPRVWFSLIDFAGVAPGSADAPTAIAAGQVQQVAFAQGLAQLSAYHFSYAP